LAILAIAMVRSVVFGVLYISTKLNTRHPQVRSDQQPEQ